MRKEEETPPTTTHIHTHTDVGTFIYPSPCRYLHCASSKRRPRRCCRLFTDSASDRCFQIFTSFSWSTAADAPPLSGYSSYVLRPSFPSLGTKSASGWLLNKGDIRCSLTRHRPRDTRPQETTCDKSSAVVQLNLQKQTLYNYPIL